MNSTYPTQILDELCIIKGGKRLPKGEVLLENTTEHPYIRARDIRNGKINFDDPKFISAEVHEKIKRYIVNESDVVITIVGANTGDVAYITDEFNSANLTENAVKLTVDRTKLNPKFLLYSLLPSYMKSYFQLIASGAAQEKLGLYKIKKVPIPLPRIEEQEKIAAILSSYDDLIENNLKRIKLLEEMAQITYEEWFIRMKFPDHEAAVFDKETGLPEGWRNSTLSNECDLVMGQSPKSEFYNFDQEGKAFHQGVKDYGYRFPTNTCWTTSGQRLAQSGDILFSVRAPVGRLNIALDEIVLGRGLAAIRHHKNAQSFIFYQLQKIFFEEDMMGGGAIFASVTKNDMLRVELKVPTDNLLEKFQALASSCDENIVNLHKQITMLTEARDILLPRLMTGMIDIEQVELPEAMLQRVEQQDNEMAEA